ncbi:hypothetical protein RhiirA5_428196 [Rhizophagus irregularis]|uniref:Uncharacterized protein n=1 Tax=Rhizophagus irregularis TaxID=588596 RepID=A0A2N0NSH7_9GLOM|nr:hypothetical protein RhiirA5_433456 [Rhizophagus irregularis]PKB97530.1 hypothetical protein RhiirA5_432947 [Rhizophagus irregularis]PKC00438.1 hypothetical protein RhiirA5_428196 [Rhizophagus irregularis]
MENQESSVNTEATTVDEINIGPIGNTQSREKSSISESERPSLVNLKNLGYNILKSLDDETVGDIEFPELDSCSECGNDILMSPLDLEVEGRFEESLKEGGTKKGGEDRVNVPIKLDKDSKAYSKLIHAHNSVGGFEEYIRITVAILPLAERHDHEIPEM